MKKSILLYVLLSWIASPFLVHAQSSNGHHQQIEEVVELVETHFYDSVAVSGPAWKKAVSQLQDDLGSATGPDQLASKMNTLLETLNTSHTHYYSKGDPKRYQLLGLFSPMFDQTQKDLFVYEGIGIDTRVVDGRFVIISVFDGFPAQKAGLKFGDRILSVDGSDFHPIESFREKAGEKVTVKVERNEVAMDMEVPVAELDGRTMFKEAAEASVRGIDHRGKKVGYIHLWSYAGMQYQELLRQEVLWGTLAACDALVLDLRDGWGGADLTYLNLFRPPIATTYFRGRDGSTGTYNGVWEKPVALLVNERTTSGKELFTYGFKKLKIGPLIGTPTAGAVLAGRIFLLSNGDVLYLAVRDVGVDGMRLEGKGVQPDLVVHRSLQRLSDADPQLQSAIEEAVRQIENSSKEGNR